MIEGSCHCGAIRFRLNAEPEYATECNCSICRRIGALWAHSGIETIMIEMAPDASGQYIQGERILAIHTCRTCGCTTHWENLFPEQSNRMAVNLRMADPAATAGLRVRHFDGAETWAFLD